MFVSIKSPIPICHLLSGNIQLSSWVPILLLRLICVAELTPKVLVPPLSALSALINPFLVSKDLNTVAKDPHIGSPVICGMQ
jgi:hypothetical protein